MLVKEIYEFHYWSKDHFEKALYDFASNQHEVLTIIATLLQNLVI